MSSSMWNETSASYILYNEDFPIHLKGFILMYSARLNYNDEYKQRKLDYINNLVMILLFILCIFNIFILSLN